MGWKDWSYVKKGIIIGGVMGLILSLFFIDCAGFLPTSESRPPICITMASNLFTILLPILCGIIIGWIIGKIKSKKEENKKQ